MQVTEIINPTITEKPAAEKAQAANARLQFLDHAKAIAIILMVLLHTTSRHPYFNELVGSFHMAVFFIIAGVFFKSNQSLWTNVKKGFFQLIIPYFVFSLLAFTICWISPYYHPELYPGLDTFPKIFKAAFIGMFIGQFYYNGYAFMPAGALWFLLTLFTCRILAFFWFYNFSKLNSKTNLILKTAVRCLIIGLLLLLYFHNPGVLSLNCTAVSFPYFLVGFYLRDFFKGLNKKSIQLKIAVFIIALVTFIICIDCFIIPGEARIEGNIVLAYLKGISGAMLVIMISMCLGKFKNTATFFSFIGVATICILGLHAHFIFVGKFLYSKVFGAAGNAYEMNMIIALAITIIAVVLSSLAYNFFLKSIPFAIGKPRKI